MEEKNVCTLCGGEHPPEGLYPFDGQLLCAGCLASETLLCQVCGARIWRSGNEGSSDVPLCADCYEEHYTHCCRCGALIRESSACYEDSDEYDERPCCARCYHALEQPIRDYSYKPEPVFFGEGPRYFGVELEIDGAGENSANARTLLETANSGAARLYIKHDGSLNDGLELVTHPMSLEYHRNEMPWAELLEQTKALGYRSHMAQTCGLHVHVSREAFGECEREQDAAVARVLYFFEKHWEELLKFSRRTPRQLERWAARYGYKEQPREILDHAKKGGGGGRYASVNLQNQDTVEFRIFRGTLKHNTLIATLQLVSRVCDVALFLSDEELKALSWTTFVSGITEPELIRYLKERRLYVNEPVEPEVEL